MQSYEALDKWAGVVHLARAYIGWRFVQERSTQVRHPAGLFDGIAKNMPATA